MRIVRAQEMGMCFGVRDALQVAGAVNDPHRVTVYGELVHNAEVNRRLSRAGYRQVSEDARDANVDTPVVLITAHGISNAERSRLRATGKQLIDTTCPLVRRAHEAATELNNEGRYLLLIGKAGHVEVQGIAEDLQRYSVIGSSDDVIRYPSLRLGIVCQTTMPPDVVTEIRDQIRLQNPLADIRFIDTVCRPTNLRQQAMIDLLGRADAVVVVGGRNSNNTRRLVHLCGKHGVRAIHVERADELRSHWFDDVDVVGLTAGTSTLDETIDEVEQTLRTFAHHRRQQKDCHA